MGKKTQELLIFVAVQLMQLDPLFDFNVTRKGQSLSVVATSVIGEKSAQHRQRACP